MHESGRLPCSENQENAPKRSAGVLTNEACCSQRPLLSQCSGTVSQDGPTEETCQAWTRSQMERINFRRCLLYRSRPNLFHYHDKRMCVCVDIFCTRLPNKTFRVSQQVYVGLRFCCRHVSEAYNKSCNRRYRIPQHLNATGSHSPTTDSLFIPVNFLGHYRCTLEHIPTSHSEQRGKTCPELVKSILGLVRIGGDDGELRPSHYIYVYSIESRLTIRVS